MIQHKRFKGLLMREKKVLTLLPFLFKQNKRSKREKEKKLRMKKIQKGKMISF